LFIAQATLVAAGRTDVHRRLGWAIVALAAIMVITAVRFRRQPQTHKRLMLLATISLLDAPVARLPFEILQTSSWAYIVATDLFLVPVILYDVISRRQVSPVYRWGGSLLIVEQLLRIPIGQTKTWHTIARAILF